MKSMESGIQDVGNRYDDLAYRSFQNEYYQYSDFLNFGYWDEHTANQGQACENLVKKLLDAIPDKTGNILDVACGKGGSTRYIMKFFKPEDITAINISEKQLETARTNAPGCKFLVMDAVRLDFEDCSFNNIICVEAAFHFNTRKKFFKEAYRVLKPGGYLVLSDLLMTLEAERKREYRTEKNYVKNPNEYEAIMRNTGFGKVDVIDATEPCWKKHFFHAVRYINQKFLMKEIDESQLKKHLKLTYQRVPDTQYYILAFGRKI
jgi:MPBQ/MSBQ methyltransferase